MRRSLSYYIAIATLAALPYRALALGAYPSFVQLDLAGHKTEVLLLTTGGRSVSIQPDYAASSCYNQAIVSFKILTKKWPPQPPGNTRVEAEVKALRPGYCDIIFKAPGKRLRIPVTVLSH